MEHYQTLIGIIAGSGIIAVTLRAIWAALWPLLCHLVETQVARIADERLRAQVLELVRAAEQIFGPQPADEQAAAAVGARKYDYVRATLQQSGLAATKAQIEAAVYEIKGAAS